MNNEEKNDMRTKLSTQKEQVEQDKNIEYRFGKVRYEMFAKLFFTCNRAVDPHQKVPNQEEFTQDGMPRCS